jgi:type IV secretion system protein VirB10
VSGSGESVRHSGEPTVRDETASAEGAPTPEVPEPATVPGERGTATVNRVRSLQSRVSNLLAAALMCALGVGALAWYYAHLLSRPGHAASALNEATRAQVSADAPLPRLGPFRFPGVTAPAATARTPPAPAASLAAQLLGPPPPLPSPAEVAAWNQADALTQFSAAHRGVGTADPVRPPGGAIAQQLGGPVFAASAGAGSEDGSAPAPESSGPPWTATPGASEGGAPAASPPAASPPGAGLAGAGLSRLLHPSVTPAVEASVLPDLRFLLPKGAFIDCTLETAIDSTLPGMTTCVTATDTFSADGKVVLLERGTKLVGETRGQIRQGQARLFVLWSEARTPTGVIVPLDSPATDSLGRSGLTGKVETHFWARFGAAILVSVIDAGVQAGVESSSQGGAVIVNPSASEDVMTGILNSTVNIPPTLTVRQGARIQVLVARDVDFRSVYRLALTGSTADRGTR